MVDGLRAPTQGLWQRLDLDERRGSSRRTPASGRYAGTGWPPTSPPGSDGYRDDGPARGRGRRARRRSPTTAPRCEVELPALPDTLFADAVVNCTGPMTDVSRSTDPLLQRAGARAACSPPTRSGSASPARPHGEVLDVSGQVVPGLYVVGPPRKGTLWETTAVPEIRRQAAALAQRLPERVRRLAPA